MVLINNLLIMCHVCSLVGLGPTMVEPDLLIPIYAYVACFHYHLILNFNLAFAIEYSKFEFMICTPRLVSGAVLQCRPSRCVDTNKRHEGGATLRNSDRLFTSVAIFLVAAITLSIQWCRPISEN